jgi:hypothetical protein
MNNTSYRRPAKLFCFLLIIYLATLTGRAEDDSSTNNPSLPPGYARQPGLPGKNVDWQDPKDILPDVNYNGLPITEVAADLKDKFPGEFDVLFPVGPGNGKPFDWQIATVSLRLKHVKASEIFNAMNLAFESGRTPLHWELTMNGHRPTALLRVLPPNPGPAPTIDPATGLPVGQPPIWAQKPMVFFVGDLVGDPKSGRMTVDQIVKTFDEISKFGFQGEHISYYDPAQLLIVRGTDDDIRFVQSTLAALREKALLDAQKIFAREHGQDESSFWPEQWTKHRRDAKPDSGESSRPAPAKTNATNAP